MNGKLKPWNFFSEKGLNLNNYLLILGLSKALRSYILLSNPRFGLYGFHRTNFPLKVW